MTYSGQLLNLFLLNHCDLLRSPHRPDAGTRRGHRSYVCGQAGCTQSSSWWPKRWKWYGSAAVGFK